MARSNPEHRKPRSEGRGRKPSCIVCGEDRESDQAHFPNPKSKAGLNTIWLCPTHHALLDDGRASPQEFETVWRTSFPGVATTLRGFIDWAYENGYQYSWADLKNKRIWKDRVQWPE